MCTFVTATLLARVNVQSLEPIFQKYGFTVDPLDGAVAARRVGTDVSYFRLASGYCCDTSILGRRTLGTPHSREEAKEKKLKELKKAAWSESRINRWLQETEKKSNARNNEDSQEADRWQGFIREMLAQGHVDHLGLLVHAYGGSLIEANLPIGKPQRVLLEDLSQSILESMKDGVLYRFVDSKF